MSYYDNKKTADEVNIEFDETKTNNIQSSIEDGKMLFVYKSAEMREMFVRYGNELVLLDATYKPTKYTLPPFFLVVKTNVNFQVCAVIVLQEASSDSSNDISVTKIDNFTFSVTGFEEGQRVRKNYRTFLGTKNKFCTRNCYNFKQYRMLCKHFFAVFQSRLAKFGDLTELFKDHPYMRLYIQLSLGEIQHFVRKNTLATTITLVVKK